MSLSTDSTQRTASPVNAGYSSPSYPKSRTKDDDRLLKKDKAYRRYASGVERVLSSFETTVVEWADYISFLGRLLKALQAKPALVTHIPQKSLVAKRLSQCLNPMLPAGVHQKTLEVYAYIFNTLGRDGLSANLSLYLPGLTPTLSFAALSVKPAALVLYETYIITLDPVSLRPALKAIIIALLPCLEEESAEEFERTFKILANLREAIASGYENLHHQADGKGDQFFWQCFFLATITSSSRRQGCLAYLTRKLPHLGSPLADIPTEQQASSDHVYEADQNAVVSPEPGLLIRCFCAGLQDEHVLIQRGFLDLLVTHLPLHSTVLRATVSTDDLERLVSAATSVVSRRDMSLNRRLWTWFLGPEPAETSTLSPSQDGFGPQSHYFEQYGQQTLTRTILNMINRNNNSPTERTRPLRICLSLMDCWEVGGFIVPAIFLPAIKSVWQYQTSEPSSEAASEVLRSARMFFDGVESGIIWAEIVKVIMQAFGSQDTDRQMAFDRLKLLHFIVNNFNIREEEMLVVHMPTASFTLLLQVHSYLQRAKNPEIGEPCMALLALSITNKMLDLIPQRAFMLDLLTGSAGKAPIDTPNVTHDDDLQARIWRFYSDHQGNLDIDSPPLSPSGLGRELLRISLHLVAMMLRPNSPVSYDETDIALAILSNVIQKVSKNETPEMDLFLESLLDFTPTRSFGEPPSLSYTIVAAKTSALETICTTPQSNSWIQQSIIRQLIPNLIMSLWPHLSPSTPRHNVEASRCMWRLQSISPDAQLIESCISSLLLAHKPHDGKNFISVENARRFSTLWTHSASSTRGFKDFGPDVGAGIEMTLLHRPLMLILDSLDVPNTPLFVFTVTWLQTQPSLVFIVNMIIARLNSVLSFSEPASNDADSVGKTIYGDQDGSELCQYYIELLLQLIQYSPNNIWPALESYPAMNGDEQPLTNAVLLGKYSLRLIGRRLRITDEEGPDGLRLSLAALLLLRQLTEGPTSASIIHLGIENPLLEELISSIEQGQCQLQVSLMEVLLVALRISSSSDVSHMVGQRPVSRDNLRQSSILSVSTDGNDRRTKQQQSIPTPPKLLHCLQLGLTSRHCRSVLDSWITFLHQCLPLYGETIFQMLIPLIDCLCNALGSAFKSLKAVFLRLDSLYTDTLDSTLGLLLNGLEQSLATAHDRLITDAVGSTPVKSPEQQQPGFFGTMVSGVFSTDTNRTRTMTANNRLTVLLCFKDAIRVCFGIWSWAEQGSTISLQDTSALASFNFTVLRLRNRIRRIFEHFFAAEALECLETLIELWQTTAKDADATRTSIFNLLHILDGTRPKNSIPAIFNAIYSRTNPNALDPVRKSTLTSDLVDTSLAGFLVAYTRSLDDDSMDEIWNDCTIFLRDVLANPMPHRQTLPKLLEFTAVLGEKVDNTNFGEQRKMRRDLGDLFVRLLTATLTIRPMGFSFDALPTSNGDNLTIESANTRKSTDSRTSASSEGLIAILAAIAPNLSKVLIDSDRIASTVTIISTQIVLPTFRSKLFPENITERMLALMGALANTPEAAKVWKKDISEAFNDPRFFSCSIDLVQQNWLPLLRQWSLGDKERMPELLARLTSPTSAGIVFGVGASSARLEADRKTQLNLRRIACLILTAAKDTFAINLAALHEKLIELLDASATSSPSSTTRSEIYMVIRALLLKTSPTHLVSLWPTVNTELYEAISSASPTSESDTYSTACLLQACKLLDTLLTLGHDDFQMQEWLFITDSAESVYRGSSLRSVAIVDQLAEELDATFEIVPYADNLLTIASHEAKRRPLLTSDVTNGVKKEEMMEKLLRPFFRQLSIYAFETTYSMEVPDWQICFDELVADLFDDNTLV